MSLEVVLHPLAERGVAWAWDEEHLPGLGDRFVAVARVAIERAAGWPDAGSPTILHDLGEVVERRATTEGFPCRCCME